MGVVRLLGLRMGCGTYSGWKGVHPQIKASLAFLNILQIWREIST